VSRIGLRATGINLDPIKNLTIEKIFGVGLISVPEFNRCIWKLIKERGLKVKILAAK